jgi:glutamate dehydrogenase
MLKEALLDADLLDDAWLADAVEKAFPRMLTEYCGGAINSHQLAAEIAATQLANDLVDRFGFSFFYRQMEATGASAAEVVRALTVVVNVLGIDELWLSIESDESGVSATRQLDLLHILIKLVRRATRWFLRNKVKGLACAVGIEQFAKPMHQLLQHWDGLQPQSWQSVDADTDQTVVEGPIAAMQTLTENLFLSLGIIEISLHSRQPVERVAEIYAAIGTELLLDELMVKIVEFAPQSRWQDLARESFFDQLEQYRRQLTSALLARGSGDAGSIIEQWRQRQLSSIMRWRRLMDDQRRHSDTDLALVTVALSDLFHVIEDLQRMPQFD